MISFIILALIIIALATISCLPDSDRLYTSLPMTILWGALIISSAWYFVTRRLYKKPKIFCLHAAFIIILAGAAITHLSSTSVQLHLRVGQTSTIGDLTVCLQNFEVKYYPGTAAPRDFISHLTVDGNNYEVAMNKIARVKNYRFFQTACDTDLKGSTLTVAHDPFGITVTYPGYAILIIFICVILIPHKKLKATLPATVLLTLPSVSDAATSPVSIPDDVASHIGQLYVYHNDRIAPVSTLADGFTRKLTGSRTYRGLSPEQVLTGWLFYYDSWKNEPCITVKDKSTRKELNGRSSVALTDFFGPEGYLFPDSRHQEVNEKFALASAASTGLIWKIFPYTDSDSTLTWLSPVDNLPESMSVEEWHVTRHTLNYLAQLIEERDWQQAISVIDKIAEYQRRHAGEYLPSKLQTVCEKYYLRLASTPWGPVIMLLGGIILLAFNNVTVAKTSTAAAIIWTGSIITLNWIASNHPPMSNGEETMQWMAFCALATSIFLYRRNISIMPLGLIVASMALFVSVMGQRTPQVTQLMPVLNSPLLSIHVLTVMLAYALFALMAMSGILWACGRKDMVTLSREMLRPAVFLLTAGIFVGAVWANVSWGRYWGWDPKEVWALITMLIYSFPLHEHIFPAFRRDRVFASFCIIAFVSVLMTYFGVNFILGGMHSYS